MVQLENSLDFYSENKAPSACLVSGGIDSMVLLELLARRQKLFFFPLTVVHFNHHLRGDESDRDEQFVRSGASKRELPVIVRHLPVKKGSGIQNRAREMRLEAVKTIASETPIRRFFLAHHADDQAETVVMRYLRGAGCRGLRGMERESPLGDDITLIRPFLEISRNQIEAWAREQGISFVQDSSNRKQKYWRNRIRHKLMPELKKGYPELLTAVAENCRYHQEKFRSIASEADRFLTAFKGEIPAGRYFTLSSGARFLVLEQKMRKAGFNKEVQKHHILEIENLIQRGRRVLREYGPAKLMIEEGFFDFKNSID